MRSARPLRRQRSFKDSTQTSESGFGRVITASNPMASNDQPRLQLNAGATTALEKTSMKTWTNAIVSLAIFLTIASCATRKDIHSYDTQVINAVVNQLCKQMGSGYYVLPLSSTVVDPAFTPRNFENGAIWQSLLDRNQRSVALPEVGDCDGLKVANQDEIDLYLKQKKSPQPGCYRWCAFYRRFIDAQGIMSLSLPGYSNQGDFAVVQVSAACGQVCGSTSFWVLRRISGRWQLDPSKSVQGPTS